MQRNAISDARSPGGQAARATVQPGKEGNVPKKQSSQNYEDITSENSMFHAFQLSLIEMLMKCNFLSAVQFSAVQCNVV